MSFNRGVKRDSFSNRRNFNRSSGGGGGGRGGNRIGSNMNNSGMENNMGGGMSESSGMSGMNPWEGGMMSDRGILSTPNNNLSLALPQVQLAIASNLLTNLLRSQQEVQPQVPSLMSLGNNYSGPGSNYPNQQNYSSGRFNDRTTRHPLKNTRPQPYKMGNRSRDGSAGRRGPSAQQSRARQSGSQRMNRKQIQHRNDKSSKPIPASKQNQTSKKEQQDVMINTEKAEPSVPKSDDADNTKDKKRDRKDEKGEAEEVVPKLENTEDEKVEDAEEKMDTSAGAEDAALKETKEASDKSEKDNAKATGKKSEARHAESRYAEVPMNHMFCHICNKHMWNGFSFENHLRGRAHRLMMDKLDESYKVKVDLMRHELRVAEEQRQLSLNNSKRRSKKVSVDFNVREYCTMCNLNFYGTLSMHRKSEKHQQLKTFLYPHCFPCLKKFPSRIEYDEHCLSPTHMKNAVQCEEQRKNKEDEKLAKGEAEVRTAEDEDKTGPKYVCETCKLQVGYKQSLIQHMKLKHSSLKTDYTCKECGNTYSTHFNAERHIKKVHNVKSSLASQYIIERVRPGGGNKEEENNNELSNLIDDADVAPKKSDEEEKYEPLEADATLVRVQQNK
ncbi:zinc finger protein on ecdysone puffs isoform X2 [Ooceraea biroi]|uniref:zinc finger protein on ecdysone puffs isoform X2 n=1 Tax=Ooceraea biroi TaxID=2015173 RepID=UPI0005BDDDF6|nr:zinc finger protein on ecdysone puffs isoform X2 [Ooceraea biroi]